MKGNRVVSLRQPDEIGDPQNEILRWGANGSQTTVPVVGELFACSIRNYARSVAELMRPVPRSRRR